MEESMGGKGVEYEGKVFIRGEGGSSAFAYGGMGSICLHPWGKNFRPGAV